MYVDNKLIIQLISLLKQYNIRRVVISSGSRHFPFTHSLENDKYFKLYSVVDERSAAFFALGLIQRTHEPVALACTSGSAIVNYGPAVSEAFHQKLPLLLVTADRAPELLGQLEDQMVEQKSIFKGFLKHNVNLPLVNTGFDEWYANRLINEALIELNHNGVGPVHINYPIVSHHNVNFNIQNLPKVRKITFNTAETSPEKWKTFANKLYKSKIIIIWGQSVNITDTLIDSLNKFCSIYNAVILTDKISNLHSPFAIDNALVVLKALSVNEKEALYPDFVISVGNNIVFNNEIKGMLAINPIKMENWRVGTQNIIVDPYRRLTEHFEMSETTFFNNLINTTFETNIKNKRKDKTETNDDFNGITENYSQRWKQISLSIKEPEVPYSQLYAIGKLIKSIPPDSILQLSNSNTIRMAHLFRNHPSIKTYCNRGVNGIDGCMSTAVGYASESSELNFLIIGDLTFFYDMNALWNRHLSPNIRILLVNNEGGGVMYMTTNATFKPHFPVHTAASHNTSAKGWVESIGFRYLSAHTKEETDDAIKILTSSQEDGPILLEVFTKKEEDALIYLEFGRKINPTTLTERFGRKAKSIIKKIIRR